MYLIAGAGGYIGKVICYMLNAYEQEFITVSNSYMWDQLPYEINRYTISLSEVCTVKLAEQLSCIIYMAGSPNLAQAQSNPSLDISFHLWQLEYFMNYIEQFITQDTRIYMLSSAGAVYGENTNNIPLSEHCATRPLSAYGMRNLALESLFLSLCNQFSVDSFSILRVSNPFGPSQKCAKRSGLIQALVNSSFSKVPVVLRDNGQQTRDYLFESDLGSLLYKLCGLSNLPKIINVASGYSFCAREIVSILNKSGCRPCVQYSRSTLDYEVKQSRLSNRKLLNILGIEKENLHPFQPEKISKVLT